MQDSSLSIRFLLLAGTAILATVLIDSGAHADTAPDCVGGSGISSTECGALSTTGQATRATAVGESADASGNRWRRD